MIISYVGITIPERTTFRDNSGNCKVMVLFFHICIIAVTVFYVWFAHHMKFWYFCYALFASLLKAVILGSTSIRHRSDILRRIDVWSTSIRGSLLSAIHSLFLSPRRMVILECLERMLRDLRSRAATKVTHVRQSGSSAWWRWMWRACYRVCGLWRERMSRWGWEQKCRHFDAIFCQYGWQCTGCLGSC